MAKQIIVLDKRPSGNIRIAFWLSVPTERQPFFADANNTSEWSGASPQEIADLQNGVITEQVVEYGNDLDSNLAAAKAFLQSEFTIKQAEITALNKWKFYGSFYDGTSWTNGGVT